MIALDVTGVICSFSTKPIVYPASANAKFYIILPNVQF